MIGPTVSVVLSTFNGARFLPEQLRSLSTQSRPPDELVVGDDCSTDETTQTVGKFGAEASFPVKLTVNSDNMGFGANFAQTVLRSSGRFIFFCDQDDSWHSDKIAKCLVELERSQTPVIVTHDAMLADQDLIPSGLTLCRQFKAAGAEDPSDMVYGCCIAFDAFFARFFTRDHRYSHDTWLAEIGRLLKARVHIDEPLIQYRRHSSNATQSHATSLSPTSRVRRLVSRMREVHGSDVRKEISEYLQFTVDLIAAFERNIVDVTDHFGTTRYQAALKTLMTRQASLKERARVLHTSRFVRPVHVVLLALSGGYSGSSWLGVCRDLVA